MDNLQHQSQVRPDLGAFRSEWQTIPSSQQGAGSSLNFQPQIHLAPGPPVSSTRNFPFAGQTQGPFGYQNQLQYTQFPPFWQPHQLRQFNNGWAEDCRQIQQILRPVEPQVYAEPQQYAGPLNSFERPAHRDVEGNSLENPICLNDGSVDQQPTIPKPTSETLLAIKEKPKSSLREYTEVTKRIKNGDWEGMSELEDLFKQLNRQWPGKYDCISQRWYINKTNPSLSYCMALNGGGIKRSWELQELMRKERADEVSRVALLKRTTVAPIPTTKTMLQKRKRTDDAESSSQPAVKRARKSTKPQAAAKLSVKDFPVETKGKEAGRRKVAGENKASRKSKTPKDTSNAEKATTTNATKPAPAYPEMFGFSGSAAENEEAHAVEEPGNEGGTQIEFVNCEPPRPGRTNQSGCTFEYVGSGPISLRRAVESAVLTEISETGTAQGQAASPKQSGEGEVQDDDGANELFEEEVDETPREQVVAEVLARGSIENASAEQDNDSLDELFEDVNEGPQQPEERLEDVPTRMDDGDLDDDFAADFQAELERQMEESEVSEEE